MNYTNISHKNIVPFLFLVCLLFGISVLSIPVQAAIGTIAQDQQWVSAQSVDSALVANDVYMMNNGVKASIAPKDYEAFIKNYQTYATALSRDSQIAMDHSNSYTVSQALLPTKNAYNAEMTAANWAGFYGSQAITAMLSGDADKASKDTNTTTFYLNAYYTDVTIRKNLYDNYIRAQEIATA